MVGMFSCMVGLFVASFIIFGVPVLHVLFAFVVFVCCVVMIYELLNAIWKV